MSEKSINFDRAIAYYDKTRGFPDGISTQIGAFIAETAKLNPHSRVLEIGIGTGRIALPFAPHVGHITGIDISSGMMTVLREKQSNEAIDVAVADAHFPPFAAKSFDAITITHVLHLVAEPVRVLKEMKRLVHDDGVFIHMHNEYQNAGTFQAVVDAWNETSQQKAQHQARWNRTDEDIETAGWQKIGETRFHYPYESKLLGFVENIEQKHWSNTWKMDEMTWRKGLEAVYAAIDKYFDGDRTATAQSEGQFIVQMYRKLR